METPKPAPDEFALEHPKLGEESLDLPASQPAGPTQPLERKLTGWQQQSIRNFNNTRTSEPKEPSESTHAHHWRIAEVQGPTSLGHCQECGYSKEFNNYPTDDMIFNADRKALAPKKRLQ